MKKTLADQLETKTGKYFLNKVKGKNKKQSALDAGFADGNHTSLIEESKTYKEIEKAFFKDELALQAIKGKSILNELASELLKNVRQDQDKGAKNKAIELALSKIEPEDAPEEREDTVMVVFKS